MPEQQTSNPSTQQLQNLESELSALKEKVAFLEKIVHEVPASIYISSLEKGVLWCNKTNEKTLGYTLDEILEMGGREYLYQVVHPEDHNVPDESIDHYEHFDGTEFGGIFRAKHKDATDYKWFMGWAKAFRKSQEGQVKELLCVDVDLSPQMNTDKQLAEALKENLKLRHRLLINTLRTRELEVLKLVCQGLSTKEIAEKLYISVNTVSTHRKNIQQKLGTNNVADMVSLAKEAGLG